MFTKKFVVGAFVAAVLATPALSACGHTGHFVAHTPAAVPTEQPPAAVPDSGTGASWSNGAGNGSDGSHSVNVPDPANTLGVPELPQYDPTLSQIHAIQNQ